MTVYKTFMPAIMMNLKSFQANNDDDNGNNIFSASMTALSSINACLGDEIYTINMEFVESNHCLK